MKKFLYSIWCGALACALFTGCGTAVKSPEPDIPLPPQQGDAITASDYSKKSAWLHLPNSNHAVDVFFLYPTSWSRQPGTPLYCEMDNKSMHEGANLMLKMEASAYKPVANLYAPYYRQVDAKWALDYPLEDMEEYFAGVPYTDAVAAFEYYLKHYNNGRPFILAGHSQGSAVTKCILKYYMPKHPEVYKRMVAAYVIGYFVAEEELKDYPHLKFAQSADDTGVIVSWNVEAPNMKIVNPLAPAGSISINPISWSLGTETAPASKNMGSLIYNQATGTLKRINNLADAKVNKERGTVECSSVDIETYGSGLSGLFPRGVYHMNDYGFYYYNLRQNVANRIEKYMAKEKK